MPRLVNRADLSLSKLPSSTDIAPLSNWAKAKENQVEQGLFLKNLQV